MIRLIGVAVGNVCPECGGYFVRCDCLNRRYRGVPLRAGSAMIAIESLTVFTPVSSCNCEQHEISNPSQSISNQNCALMVLRYQLVVTVVVLVAVVQSHRAVRLCASMFVPPVRPGSLLVYGSAQAGEAFRAVMPAGSVAPG